MSDTAVRLLVLGVIVAASLIVAFVANRVRTPPHPTVRVAGGLGDRPGVVLFTSTTCGTCKEAIGFLEGEGVAFREVTEELEAQKFEDSGVVAVPVTVVLDREGATIQTFAGVPRRASFRRAISAAGIGRSNAK